jgi:hypothetical protein
MLTAVASIRDNRGSCYPRSDGQIIADRARATRGKVADLRVVCYNLTGNRSVFTGQPRPLPRIPADPCNLVKPDGDL